MAFKERVHTTKLVIEQMMRNIENTPGRSYDTLEHFLTQVGKRPQGMEVLMQLAHKKNGLEDFVRTLIKNHLSETKFKAMEQSAKTKGMSAVEYGGTRRKRRRNRTRRH